MEDYGIELRRTVEPLDFSCSINEKAGDKVNSSGVVVGINFCPLTQTYDADNSKFVVDRGDYPTVIVPSVNLKSKDKKYVYDILSSHIANVVWYVKHDTETVGTPITSHSEWANLYSIDTTSAEKYSLTIKKNVQSGESWRVWFECDFDDERSGYTKIIHLKSNEKLLKTMVNAETQYTMSLSRPNCDVYDPLLDKRILYDYKKQKGLLADGETFTDDGRTYLREVDVTLRKGKNVLSAGKDFTLKIERYSAGTYTLIDATSDDIESIAGNAITFNFNKIADTTWRISCYKGENRMLCTKDYSFMKTLTQKYKIVRGSANTFRDGDKEQTLAIGLVYANEKIEYPEAYINAKWIRTNTSGVEVTQGYGIKTTLDMEDSSVVTTNSKSIKMRVSLDLKSERKYLTDQNGNRIKYGDSYLTIF